MPEVKPRRGRPKGTGIDDSDRIARLVESIRNKPDLKPTTAIRAMGITDPSIIRRLRDKYSEHQRIAGQAAAALVLAPATGGALRASAPSTDGVPADICH